MNASNSRILRLLALVAVVGNAAWNYAAERFSSSVPSIAEASARYDAPFTPAPYAF